MDFSNPYELSGELEAPKSPITKYVTWMAGAGEFGYRENKGDKENPDWQTVSLGESIFFVPMVTFSTVSGWSKTHDKRIWANEVMNTKRDMITVKAGGEEIASGYWQDIADTVKADDGNFTYHIYGMLMQKGKDSEIIVLELYKTGLQSWMEKKPTKGNLYTLKRLPKLHKKGKSEWYLFECIDVNGDIKDEAKKAKAKDKVREDSLKVWPTVGEYLTKRAEYIEAMKSKPTVDTHQQIGGEAQFNPAPPMDLTMVADDQAQQADETFNDLPW